jgi:hypothetical protein
MQMSRFLRLVLLADAAATVATGALLAAASAALETWLSIPSSLLFYAGIVLLPYAAFVFYLASQDRVSRATVWVVIGCNAVWAIDSVLLLATGWIAPSTLGYIFVIGQAIIVAAFCQLQFSALRVEGLRN